MKEKFLELLYDFFRRLLSLNGFLPYIGKLIQTDFARFVMVVLCLLFVFSIGLVLSSCVFGDKAIEEAKKIVQICANGVCKKV